LFKRAKSKLVIDLQFGRRSPVVTLCSFVVVVQDRQDVKSSACGARFDVWQAPRRAKADTVHHMGAKWLVFVESRLWRRAKHQSAQR